MIEVFVAFLIIHTLSRCGVDTFKAFIYNAGASKTTPFTI
jgi:hypothetical protein